MAVTDKENKLIDRLIALKFNQNDVIGVMLVARELKICQELLDWLNDNESATAEELFTFINDEFID